MQLSQKIQALRKEKGLTQEEFAKMLFVSRTAVSKWETGRGIPSIDSLQAIAKLFSISLEELLSADEIIMLAKNESKESVSSFRRYIKGILNLSCIITAFLPLYKIQINNYFYSVPLYALSGWLMMFFWLFTLLMTNCGIIQIIFNQKGSNKFKNAISITANLINVIAIFVLILSGQPYPAILFLCLLLTKISLNFIK